MGLFKCNDRDSHRLVDRDYFNLHKFILLHWRELVGGLHGVLDGLIPLYINCIGYNAVGRDKHRLCEWDEQQLHLNHCHNSEPLAAVPVILKPDCFLQDHRNLLEHAGLVELWELLLIYADLKQLGVRLRHRFSSDNARERGLSCVLLPPDGRRRADEVRHPADYDESEPGGHLGIRVHLRRRDKHNKHDHQRDLLRDHSCYRELLSSI